MVRALIHRRDDYTTSFNHWQIDVGVLEPVSEIEGHSESDKSVCTGLVGVGMK